MSKERRSNPLISLATGALAGGIEAVAVWPMEYIKTQLQLHKNIAGITKPLPYRGVFSGITYTVRTTGFFSLYNGLGITLVGSIPKAGIRFGGNAYFKKILADEHGKLTMGKNFLAGMGAGAIEAVVAVTPMETVKTKLMQNNLSLIPGLKHIWKESGISGFYQGVGATVLKQSSNQGLRFMFFNKYKEIITQDGQTSLNPLTSLLGGMMAGCFSTLGNNPFDVVKTRMQGKDAHLYSNTLDCFGKLFKEEGILVFYRGVVPRLGRVIPGQGVIFMSFETIQSFIEPLFD